MSLGGSGKQKVKVKRSKEEKEAQRLYVEGLRLRNQFLPFLMQDAGFGTDASGNLSRLPKTAQQTGMDDLALNSLAGANQAAGMMQGRFNLQQSMLPGLMRSVQASMAPGTQSAWSSPMASLSQMAPRPQAQTTPPPGPIQGPNSQFFSGVPDSDTVHQQLKGLGYGKPQRQQMPLSTMLSLMGGNMDTINPMLASKGINATMPLQEFFGGAPFNTNQYDFTLDQILQLLQQQGGGG